MILLDHKKKDTLVDVVLSEMYHGIMIRKIITIQQVVQVIMCADVLAASEHIL
jgi:hypothetical protein